MRIFLLAAFFFVSVKVIGCSGTEKSFCYIHSVRPGDNVICGVITGMGNHFVTLNVIDVLYGIETKSAVVIWDGTDFDCTGNISMKASLLGQVGDTLVVILPKITYYENTWDVIGDYRLPYWLFETSWLAVQNDSVRGSINSTIQFGVWNKGTRTFSYSDFKIYWQEHSGDCQLLSVGQLTGGKIEVHVLNRIISVSLPDAVACSATLYSLDGRAILKAPVMQYHLINCDLVPPGIYLLKLQSQDKVVAVKKIVL